MKTQRLFTSVRCRLLVKNVVDVVHFSSSILEGSRRSHHERLSVAFHSCPEASIVAALARRNIPRGARDHVRSMASSLENARRRFHPTMRSFVFQIRPMADIFMTRRSRKSDVASKVPTKGWRRGKARHRHRTTDLLVPYTSIDSVVAENERKNLPTRRKVSTSASSSSSMNTHEDTVSERIKIRLDSVGRT